MSEENKRVELNDDQVEAVAGGNILYVCTATEAYAYGSHNPDVKYGFSSRKAMVKFVAENYDLYGEAGTLQAMVAAGIVWPL